MSGKRGIVSLLIAAGLAACLFASCGDDNGGGPECTNCDFWDRAFGGVGHYPAASPSSDASLVAFTSTRPTGTYSHVWIARLAEGEDDTTLFYQMTTGSVYDAKPAWSPDGRTIAFERRTGNISEIYTVDVSDLEAPGAVAKFTTRDTNYDSFTSPGWNAIGADTFIVFSAAIKGGGDYDVLIKRFPGTDAPAALTIDPSDYARNENSVLSAVFKDQQTAASGSLVAFASPDRVSVVDIQVRARSVEHPDTSEAAAAIWLNDKDSGKKTPYTFRYRPVGSAAISVKGRIHEATREYCVDASVSLVLEPGAENDVVLDFTYKRGTVGFSSNPGVRLVYFDGTLVQGMRTPGLPGQYEYLSCVDTTAHTAYAANVTTGLQCSPLYTFKVNPGETTFVNMDCTGGLLEAAPAVAGISRAPGAIVSTEPAGPNGVWVLDLPEEGALTDATLYLAGSSAQVVSEPALSPDGKYIVYLRGIDRSREIVVSDVSGLLAGGGTPQAIVIGMPGSLEDVECWRIPERVGWLPGSDGRKIIASFSICRGGAPNDYEVWIADLSRFIQ